jgi:hypothetical protein
MKVSGVAGLKSAANDVRVAGLVLLGAGAVLYWAAGFLYAREIRRLLDAKAGDGGG